MIKRYATAAVAAVALISCAGCASTIKGGPVDLNSDSTLPNASSIATGPTESPINLVRMVGNADEPLSVSHGGPVPWCYDDAASNATATFDAFLAQYSYLLGADNQADVDAALSAMTRSQEIRDELIYTRNQWRQQHSGTSLWFTNHAGSTLSIDIQDAGSGNDVTLTATGRIDIWIYQRDPNARWAVPKHLVPNGYISGMTLRFEPISATTGGNRRELAFTHVVNGAPNSSPTEMSLPL